MAADDGATGFNKPGEAESTGYEPPSVRDIDTSEQPGFTEAGAVGTVKSGPITPAAPERL